VKKTPVEGRVKKTPEGTVKKTPAESRAKKTPEGPVKKTPVEDRVKKADPPSRKGRSTMTSTP
jgi:hypothetical protein